MVQKNPGYYEQLAEIEDRIERFEETSIQMNEIRQQLNYLETEGFEKEKNEIRSYLYDLHSFKKVTRLMNKLQEKIKNYHIEYEMLQNEFDELPLDLIDKDKKKEIKRLSASPKTIKQAWRWIKNIQKHIDIRDRVCFPQELTQYTNEYLIGTGGFSRVYKVKNIKKNQIVAVKIPMKNDEIIGKSFLKELNNWVALDHKNIVKIYQYNILPVLYIEMEWCDRCLNDIKKPVQFNRALYYIHEIGEGLQYAHQHDIAHLDLKPQNILLKNDIPKITDWGLSRLLSNPGTTTLGISLPFGAPEQFSTKYGKKDAKTDIWQLGILLYHLLTNSFPFTGEDFAEYGKNVTTKNIKKMISEDESIKDVSHILLTCLSRRKKDRYKNMKTFLNDLQEIM